MRSASNAMHPARSHDHDQRNDLGGNDVTTITVI